MTNEQGFYQFYDVDEGIVNVTVSKSGYDDNVTDVEVVAGATTVHDVYLDPSGGTGGIGTLAIAAGIVLAVIAAVAVLYMLKRKKSGGDAEELPVSPEEPAPPHA